MLIDDHKRFVELVVDNMLWGNVKINFDLHPIQGGSKDILDLATLLGRWIGERMIPNSTKFETLTLELYMQLLGARTSGGLLGELVDRDHDQKMRNLEEDNKKLAGIIAEQKKQLDQLYLESPDKKNIRGIS